MSDTSNIPAILAAVANITGSAIESHPGIENSSIFELGIDSLNVVELIFQLEQDLNLDIPLTELNEDAFRSIHHLNDHLRRLQSNLLTPA